METNAIAQGQLRHHFWGRMGHYRATIGLVFESVEMAAVALGKLGGLWRVATNNHALLVWHGDSTELDACKTLLGTFGADVAKIDSLKYSIDCGEPFSVSIPVHFSHPDQLSLFG